MKRIGFAVLVFVSAAVLLSGARADAKAKPKKPELNKKKITIKNGKSFRLKLKNCKKKVKWSSEDSDIVAINAKGKITAKHLGEIIVKAEAGKRTYKCKVTVKTNIDEDAIKIKYENDIFTKAVLKQVKEFRFLSKVVRDEIAVKELFGRFAGWKLTEAQSPEGVFDNPGEDGQIKDGTPPEMIFLLKNGETLKVQFGGRQVCILKFKEKQEAPYFSKLYDVAGWTGQSDVNFIDEIDRVAEDNRVVYFW